MRRHISLLAVVATLVVPLLLGAPSAWADMVMTPEQHLGKMLFFSDHLSEPLGESCSDCHHPDSGFADPASGFPSSAGAISTRFGPRNAQTSAYAAYAPVRSFSTTVSTYVGGQFWDGRAATLEIQAQAPFLNPLEMHMQNKEAVVSRLMFSEHADEFRAVYGPDSLSLKGHGSKSYTLITQAIAAYERTPEMSPFTAKHDYAMMLTGPDRMMVFTPAERMGMMLFNGKAKCNVCHTTAMTDGGDPGTIMPTEPVLFTDFRFSNLGIPKNWDSPYLYLPTTLNPAGANYIDHGLAASLRGGVKKNPRYDGMFKTPTLRNVALTAPYGHNGYFKTLKEVVHFYNTRDVPGAGWPAPEVPRNLETATMGNLGLTPTEEDQIVAFMGTLTDGWFEMP